MNIECVDTEERSILNPVRSEGNLSELFIDGQQTLNLLLDQIQNAEHYIHFQVMLFYSDKSGIQIAKALAKRAEEGLEVRVMSDSEMSFIVRTIEKIRSHGSSNFDKIKDIFRQSGVKFVSSDKESYGFTDWSKKRNGLKEQGVPEKFLKMQDMIQNGISSNINVFDHRKIFVFDGERAIVTGANLGKNYQYNEEQTKESSPDWHDGAVLIEGPCSSILNEHFASKWMVRGGDLFDYTKHYRTRDSYGEDTCTVYSHFPGMEKNHLRNWYLNKIRDCEKRLIIENPYMTDEEFWKTLSELSVEQARKITIINPYKAKGNDFPQNESSIKCRMWKPFRNGISFFAYQKRMTHWKIALDTSAFEVFIGSYNLNHRSAFHDFELNVCIKSERLSTAVLRMLEHDMTESMEITDADEFYRQPVLHASCLLLAATEYFE